MPAQVHVDNCVALGQVAGDRGHGHVVAAPAVQQQVPPGAAPRDLIEDVASRPHGNGHQAGPSSSTASTAGIPRYASLTPRSASTSATEPAAILRPCWIATSCSPCPDRNFS